jgi:hypothetical protein
MIHHFRQKGTQIGEMQNQAILLTFSHPRYVTGSILIVAFVLLRVSSRLSFSEFSIKIVYISPLYYACSMPTLPVSLNFIIQIICGEEYTL